MKNFSLFILLTALAIAAVFAISCGGDDDDSSSDDDYDGTSDDTDDGSQNEASSCEDTPTVLGSADTISTLLGISANDILDETGGGFTLTAAYTDDTSILMQTPLGGQSDLTVTITYDDGEIREIESVPVDGESEINAICQNRMEIDVTVGFATADGAFAETWDAVLAQAVSEEGTGFDAPTLSAEFDPYAVVGTFEIVSIEGVTPDSVTGTLYTTAADPQAGSVDILVQQTSGTGDDGTVSEAQHIALSWGGAS
jgi:hypothetical protein